MSFVLTVVARDTLDDADIRQFVSLDQVVRLDHRAADIQRADSADVLKPLADAAYRAGLDAHISALNGRQKHVLICDMDSTIIEQECIDELARVIGIGDEIAAITERAMQGELDFNAALTERVGRLAGTPESAVADLLANVITVSAGAKDLVRTMAAHGAHTALVSGGFTHFTGPIADRVGFAENAGNRLAVQDGHLTGSVEGDILGRDAKRASLERMCTERGLHPRDAVAIGDGANDLAMIEIAGLGIAYRAKPAVSAVAGARIDHTDLTAALYFQGLSPIMAKS